MDRKTKLTLWLLLLCVAVFAQKSEVKAVSSDRNKLSIQQTAVDSTQQSAVSLDKSNGNVVEVRQQISPAEPVKDCGFTCWIQSTDNIFSALLSIATLVSLGWAGYKFLKARKKKNQR